MQIVDGKVVVIDSRGKPSVTLPLVYAAFCGVMYRFLAPAAWGNEMLDGVGFGAALAAVGGIWLWRENQSRPKAE